jgi:hypothetical protein
MKRPQTAVRPDRSTQRLKSVSVFAIRNSKQDSKQNLNKKLPMQNDGVDYDENETEEYYQIDSKPNIERKRSVQLKIPPNRRPHTSLAISKESRLERAKSIISHMPERQSLIENMPENYTNVKTAPTKDDRYLSLINSMNTMYKPGTLEDKENTIRKVDNIIKTNKALYGRIEQENPESAVTKEYKFHHENMKLFEALVARYY